MSQVIEADETGRLVLPAELLGAARPRARYVVETQGSALVLRPEAENLAKSKKPRRKKSQSHEQWMQDWKALSEQISNAWIGDESGLDELTEMRNARGQDLASDH